MFVCLSVPYLCSVWPAKRLGRSRPNLTHALMSTQGVFLSRSVSRSFMYACGSDRITNHCAKATPGERCSNYVRRMGEATPGERVITARVTRRGAAGAEQRAPKAREELRSGGRVITASIRIKIFQYKYFDIARNSIISCILVHFLGPSCQIKHFQSLVFREHNFSHISDTVTHAKITLHPDTPVPEAHKVKKK